MFNSHKNQPSPTKAPKKAEVAGHAAVTILTSGCHFSGKLYCRGSTRIGGHIEGEIISEGLLIIEDEAKINANIKADEVVIQGQVEGKLEARGRVELTASSSFSGDIMTPVIVIREGAQFNGRSKMATQGRQGRVTDVIEKSPEITEDMNFDEVETKEVAFNAIPEISAQ